MPAVAMKPKASISKDAPSVRSSAKAVKTKAPPRIAASAKPRPAAATKAQAPKAKLQAPAEAKPAAAQRPRRMAARIDPDQHRHYVEVAAYFIAEQRGFLGGCQIEDWVLAENEIERMLREGKLSC